MRNKVLGEQLAQVDNPDPFAPPVWRSPVYRTPEGVIWVVQLVRLLVRVVVLVVRHPYLDLAAGVVVMVWLNGGWPAVCGLAASVVVTLAVWWWRFPGSFRVFVVAAVRNRWRWWFYRRRWQPVLTVARLVPTYRGRVLVPVLGAVQASRFADRVTVTLVSGQSPEDFADRSGNLSHGFRVHLCRVRTGAPGTVVLELVRRDALADPIPALPINPQPDLRALPVGRCEDGSPWRLRLHGTHVLVAGATGAGKGSVVWSAVRALLPLLAAGLVRVWACDPKLMELAFGRALFDGYGRYAADPEDIAGLLGAGLKDLMARMGHDSERAAMIYQHEARGADKAITNAIDSHVQAGQRDESGDDDGLAGALVPTG